AGLARRVVATLAFTGHALVRIRATVDARRALGPAHIGGGDGDTRAPRATARTICGIATGTDTVVTRIRDGARLTGLTTRATSGRSATGPAGVPLAAARTGLLGARA